MGGLFEATLGGPEHALRYLGCYTHRVAISNHRLVSFANNHVTFRWRDSANKNEKRLMSLHVHEFLRRFLLHVLPKGFVRIRHFGLAVRKNSDVVTSATSSIRVFPTNLYRVNSYYRKC